MVHFAVPGGLSVVVRVFSGTGGSRLRLLANGSSLLAADLADVLDRVRRHC